MTTSSNVSALARRGMKGMTRGADVELTCKKRNYEAKVQRLTVISVHS
jgi:hypothetical protein